MKEINSQVKDDLKNYFQDRDYGVVAVPKEDAIRALVVKTTNLCEIARLRHKTSPIATAVLGRALTGAILLTSLLKHGTEQRILLKIEGDGPIGLVVAEANAKGEVRGFVQNPNVPTFTKKVNGTKKFDIAKAVGKGTLTVVKDFGFGTPYESTVPLVSGEIAEDIAYYLLKSEQIPSAVSLGVLVGETGKVEAAGGFLAQPLPGVTEEAISRLEENVKKMPPISTLVKNGKRPEDIVEMLFEGFTPNLLALKELSFKCKCSKEVAEGGILVFPEDEIEALIKEGGVSIKCNFCNEEYFFNKEELEKILEERKKNTN
ncbi:33 kDa chaperonin [Desulfurobacterium thermolithotrophum DSM 11699]|uniref:33 kDa chaperonin n=1 Tax=Desulfurobacterium thermolithotrophum (strain DSM 11699 / BSA) TaxID=868864 RepID=F0S485_DESTD|nr:Hsp33 family molecular chaperone HslO [Desulfurobacterium thermolithotrophum]ADY73657.1 33 kDa chaperonin [Desulfurobacterium thermolithotrophum DSM 11699]